jgi:ribose 5-phosphate isomerase B
MTVLASWLLVIVFPYLERQRLARRGAEIHLVGFTPDDGLRPGDSNLTHVRPPPLSRDLKVQCRYQNPMPLQVCCSPLQQGKKRSIAARTGEIIDSMRIYVGSDHAGFELKRALKAHLQASGHDIFDCGPEEFDAADDYPPFCIDTARRVIADPGSLGIVIGGSGNGEQIAANKVRGVRAALAYNIEIARLAREHNDANVIGIGARAHTAAEACEIVDAFVATDFSYDERHIRRIAMLSSFESADSQSA